jgi:hypothetical protein
MKRAIILCYDSENNLVEEEEAKEDPCPKEATECENKETV